MSESTKDASNEFVRKILEEAFQLLMNNLPTMKEVAIEIIDLVFVPKTIIKQLLLVTALQTGVVTIRQVESMIRGVLSAFSSRSRLTRQLQEKQRHADTQDEWMELAECIDNIQGNDGWRSDPNCPLYERDRITARIDELVHLMRRRDVFELMFTLRGGIGRNKFGLLHEGLFSKALAGSKILVETYHNVVCAALDVCCDAPVPPTEELPIPTDARLAFFNETRHSYGRTALLLSGGAALGFYHVGVVKALMTNGLLPRVLGGSSAGSILCAMVGTRTDEECTNDLFQVKGTTAPGHYGQLRLSFFRPVGERKDTSAYKSDIGRVYHNTAGFLHDAKRTWQIFVPIGLRRFTSLLFDLMTGNRRPQDVFMNDTEYFRDCVRINVGDFTFQEAFDRTGRILNITVTPKNTSDPPRLLNYLTAPHVLVWSAAVASSSLPGVFEANKLMVRDADGTERFESAEPTARFADGSMEQDLPMEQLSEMFNVNHFIVSQANPHAVWFASLDITSSVWSNPIMGLLTGTLDFLKNQVRGWFRDMVTLVGGRNLAPLFQTRRGIFSQFFVQEYEGRDSYDISLIPWINHRNFFSALLHCIYNPSEQEFLEWGKAAERETWKYIPAIKSHIAEEVTLDRCVQRLRKRLIVDSWKKKHQSDSTGQKMGSRVPSFFTSPSLVHMGGLGIGDQTNLSFDDEDSAQKEYDDAMRRRRQQQPQPQNDSPLDIDFVGLGWGGQGLRGNFSSASLNKSGSGLFIDGGEEPVNDDEDDEKPKADDSLAVSGSAVSIPSANNNGASTSSNELSTPGDPSSSYIKTTNMARFYYRKTASFEALHQLRATKSHDQLSLSTEPISDSNGDSDSIETAEQQQPMVSRKYKSAADLGIQR